jgi:hypothetical protein
MMVVVPTCHELDVAISDVRAATTRLGAALFELDADCERRSPEALRFTGLSSARWSGVVAQVSALWSWYGALSEAVEAIKARRGESRPRQARVEVLWMELHQPAVDLPGEIGQASEVGRVPIAAAIETISSTFESTVEILAWLFAVEEVLLPRISDLDVRLAEVEAKAGSGGVAPPESANALREQLRRLRRQVIEDPLSVDPGSLQWAGADMERIEAEIGGSLATLGSLSEHLEAFEATLTFQVAAIAEARPLIDEAARKIVDSGASPRALEDLVHSASSLQRRIAVAGGARGSDLRAASEAARDIDKALSELADSVRSLTATAAAELGQRRELRGRLDAYRAKVQLLGRGEDPVLERIYRATHDVLYSAPCDLEEAERRVTAYATAVAGSATEDRSR